MQLVYAACLLLALFEAVRRGLGPDHAAPMAPACRPSGKLSPWQCLTVAGLMLVVLAFSIARAAMDRYLVFDDAYMSYRYAQHLGEGLGLRWNAGEAPVEGFTNLFLVLILAPFLRFGADPLLVTRVISLGAAFALAICFYVRSRPEHGRAVALAVALSYLAGNRAFSIAMVGLETLLFAALIFLAFHWASQYLSSEEPRWLRAFGITAFAALLTRPEAIFLVLLVTAAAFLTGRRAKQLMSHLGAIGLSFWLPFAAYLVFKWTYFGDLLPNPAYVKAMNHAWLVESGTASVVEFFSEHWKLVLLIAPTTLLPFSTREARVRALAAAFTLCYLAFYLRVDTLMDIYGRFLFPLVPFLFELARPLVERAHAAWLAPRRGFAWSATAALVFMLAGFAGHDGTLTVIRRALAGEANFPAGPSVAENFGHSYHVQSKAMMLGKYPGIERLTLASVDAGVLAYNSRARHVDTVGLNDRFIARERDIRRLTDYFFGRKPDIIIQRGRVDGSLITYGHGALGDITRWVNHPGWNDYVYAGSIIDVQPWRHELHVLVRREAPSAERLRRFVRDFIADRVHEEMPITLGTFQPATDLSK